MKYEFTGETKIVFGVTLKRIKKSNTAEIGGRIESKKNLDVSGNAWVYGNAQVYGNARVSGNARVYGNARVSGNAWVSGNAQVSGNARVSGNAQVSGNARVSGNAQVSLRLGCQYIFNGQFGMTVTETTVSVGCQIYSHAVVKSMEWESVKDKIKENDFYRLKCLALILIRMIEEAKEK